MVKKIGAFFLTVLLFCCMSVPAMAAETVEQQVSSTFRFNAGSFFYIIPTTTFSSPRYNDHTPIFDLYPPNMDNNGNPSSFEIIRYSADSFSVSAPDDAGFYGNVSFYLSFYLFADSTQDLSNVVWTQTPNALNSDVTVTTSTGEVINATSVVTTYDVDASPYSCRSNGYTFKFNMEVPETTPYVNISFGRYQWMVDMTNPVYEAHYGVVVPSCVFIAGRTSEETKAIEELTEIVIEQNNISNQYYTNVISKVDQIYSEVNNIQELQQEVINRMDEFNEVTSIPGSVTTKTEQAAQLITGLEGLEKPDPEQIVPDLTVDTTEISQVLGAFFQNALIMQVLLMSLGFCLVSYVLYGKK